MGRDTNANLNTILSGSHAADYLVDLDFPTRPTMRFATKPMTYASESYTNKLTSVGEIRMTLEQPVDRVKIELANHDGVIGKDCYDFPDEWALAEVTVRRQYAGSGLTETRTVFVGAVQTTEAVDEKVRVTLIPDAVSKGRLVAARTLAQLCGFGFKDPKTCAYTGGLTTCNRHLKSEGGCDGRANSHHFGGTEHRYNPDLYVPGTGGNTGGGGGGATGGYCPRNTMFVLARGAAGDLVAKRAGEVTTSDMLWHPVLKTFHRVRSAESRWKPIWEMTCLNGARFEGSKDQPVIQGFRDETGYPLYKMCPEQPVLTLTRETLRVTSLLDSGKLGVEDYVVRISLEDGHLYAAGADPLKLVVLHNSKPLFDE
jgi:hypothetical protein